MMEVHYVALVEAIHLQVAEASKFSDFRISGHFVITLSIPPTWRHAFVVISVKSLRHVFLLAAGKDRLLGHHELRPSAAHCSPRNRTTVRVSARAVSSLCPVYFSFPGHTLGHLFSPTHIQGGRKKTTCLH